jgi:cytosine/adenosine deaminase-related metal-dependent hydrolase
VIAWRRPIAFVNARVAAENGDADAIRFGSRVLAIGERPKRGDVVVDLDGAMVLPGLINAHDHLELNHYGRIKYRDRYANVAEWIDDMRAQLPRDPRLIEGRSSALSARLLIGVLKNLLAGVTTVAHHNPLYRELRHGVPVRLVRRYGWAHSFLLEHEPAGANGEPGGEVAERFGSTPSTDPFVVHLAEGVDDQARSELPRLEALGCLRPNTVLVHGVAIDEQGWQRVARSGAGVVWCPASNQFLFGRTAAIPAHVGPMNGVNGGRRVAIGTDSRLTGARDLLEELRVAASLGVLNGRALLRMATGAAAAMLKLHDVGTLTPGACADLIVIPARAADPGESLLRISRSDILLVAVGGRPRMASLSLDSVFRARRVKALPILVDGVMRLADARITTAVARCPIQEPGVECV